MRIPSVRSRATADFEFVRDGQQTVAIVRAAMVASAIAAYAVLSAVLCQLATDGPQSLTFGPRAF